MSVTYLLKILGGFQHFDDSRKILLASWQKKSLSRLGRQPQSGLTNQRNRHMSSFRFLILESSRVCEITFCDEVCHARGARILFIGSSFLHLRHILARTALILAIKNTEYRDHFFWILTHDCI